MFKRIANYAMLAVLLLAALLFSLENDSIIFVNLILFGNGIETPLWTYTIALLFTGAVFGILATNIVGMRKKIQK